MENKSAKIIDELGRVVLPAEARRAMQWDEQTLVEIWVNATDNEIVIKRHTVACCCCGGTEDLKPLGKKHFCSACQKKIARL